MLGDSAQFWLCESHVEFELSAQEKADEPPEASYESMIPITVPYVPATVTKDPKIITNTLRQTMGHQVLVFLWPVDQLSYSHMQPYGWRHRIVPRRAPISDTSASNTGMLLAIIYATTVMPSVQLSQHTQWVMVLVFRWREPRRRWTKIYFAGI